MARLRLIHWHDGEAATHAKTLRAMGHRVAYDPITGPETFKQVRESPPDLFVICLDRLPSHGREVAGGLREFKTTRDVPILFVGGTPDKVARLKKSLPEAHHTSWKNLKGQITKAMANPPSLSAMQDTRWAGYSGTPLPKKLGIKENSRVALAAAPRGFSTTLGTLPPGAKLRSSPAAPRDLTVWFVRSLKDLKAAIPKLVAASKQGTVWIAWPKKTSALAADVGEKEVRGLGLKAGMVDYKICAIDETWSGLAFVLRKR